jgi:hypothetical protein
LQDAQALPNNHFLGVQFLAKVLLGTIATILITLLTFVPRKEIGSIFARPESCASFIYHNVVPFLRENRIQTTLLAAPCGMPGYPLREFKLQFGGYGWTEYTQVNALKAFRRSLTTSDAVVVELDSLLANIVTQEWGTNLTPVRISPSRRFAVFLRP